MTLREEVEQLKKSLRSVKPQKLHRLLDRAGFTRRASKGDYWVYTHPRLPYPLTVDPRNPLLPAYVSKAIRAVEEVIE
jgi:predicted RNA binding protein YcfA (HicA-like mRNA interferase family)